MKWLGLIRRACRGGTSEKTRAKAGKSAFASLNTVRTLKSWIVQNEPFSQSIAGAPRITAPIATETAILIALMRRVLTPLQS
ncbi:MULTISPECIES: hypothetical protein [unclassified Rhizobium]|uniref:hypothetical protein n=1 Tax=unclassified Rhizobium TaxID=2613769 RepID=UPI0013C4939B|nr:MULTISPECIES: hypothetical protein [unclassified Rhizobium]